MYPIRWGTPYILALLCSCILLVSACSVSHQQVPDHSAHFEPLLNGLEIYTSDQYGEAFRLLDSIYAAFPNPSPLDLSKKYYFKLDHYWLALKEPKMGNVYIDSILHVLADFRDDPACAKMYGLALLCRGDIFRDELKFSEAIAQYFEGRKYIQQSEDTCMFYEFDGRIAMVYYRQKKFTNALPYFQEAFESLYACTKDTFYRFHYQQGLLDNMGLCYRELNRHDSALFYYDSALHYIQQFEPVFKGMPERERNIQVSKAVIYGNMGEAYWKTGDTARAERLYKASIAINLQKGNEVWDGQGTIIRLVSMLLSQKRYDNVPAWLDQLKNSIDSLPNAGNMLGWLRLQSQYHEEQQQPLLALNYLRSYFRMKDSLDNANNPLSSINTQQQFDFLANDYELKLLKKENEVKNAYLIVSGLFLVMAIGIMLQVWYNAKAKSAHAAKLQLMNGTISKQNEILEESLSSLEQSHQNNTKMMKIVAHDLRNPIGAIIPLSDFLRDSGEISEHENLGFLTLIRESASHSLQLIQEMMQLDISSDICREQGALHTVMQYCISLLEQQAGEKEQRIIANLQPVVMAFDREKMWRVFSNLITNAIKFSPLGGVIRVSMESNGLLVWIVVQDNGIGIPEALQEKLFTLSETARRTGTSGEQSFGLGLFICKQIVEAHSGRIWAESMEGEGTTFRIEMPVFS